MKDFVDDLYQQAAENPDIPFNEQAWVQMEQKLIHAERRRRWGLFWLFFLVMLGLGLGLLWGIQGLRSLQLKEQPRLEEPIARKSPQTKSSEQKPSLPDRSKDSPVLKDVKEENLSLQVFEKKEASKAHLTDKFQKRIHLNGKNKHNPIITANTSPQVLTTASPLRNDTSLHPDSTDQALDLANRVPESAVAPLTNNWPIQVSSSQTLSNEPLLPLPAPIMTKPKTILKSWGIGLSAGPDLASVNANGSTAYGLNAGLALDYRLGKRWVLQGSAQYLLKNYIADQREYVAPPGFWPGKMYPKSTEGTCDMLQWSVDVRYNWLARAKWKAFVGAGSSSWTILREQYEFYYTKNYPGQIYEWSSGQNKNYWFALGQFGLGVERSLRPGLNFQVNWFAQMPFQGVGNGKVEIYSSGVGFMVHQQLGRGKK